jgi:hypothetical protein
MQTNSTHLRRRNRNLVCPRLQHVRTCHPLFHLQPRLDVLRDLNTDLRTVDQVQGRQPELGRDEEEACPLDEGEGKEGAPGQTREEGG